MADENARAWRLSLRGLLVFMGAAAFACAGMVRANEWWLMAFTAASLLVFMTAVVMAVVDRGARQAFAIGFLLCGGFHLAALRWATEMPTRTLVEKAYELVSRKRFRVSGSAAAAAHQASEGQLKRGDMGPLVVALQEALNERAPPLVGGYLAQAVYLRRKREATS